jgi:transcription initiation factor TFIIIB Brf1 subunit/transcription initiation factor TFIIB
MDVKACEHCGSFNTSEDLSTNEITCNVCHKTGRGKLSDFTSIISKKGPRLRKPIDPFSIQQKIHIDYSKDQKLNVDL